MTEIIQIGNSQGVRIPKALIKQAKLQGSLIEFIVLKDGLLLSPQKKLPRHNWNSQKLQKLSQQEDTKELVQDFAPIDCAEWKWE